jgi:hypothetical protein
MKLLTKTISKKIPFLNSQDGKGDAAIAYLKLFTPWSSWTWYVTEMDPETKECFGRVDGFERELGYLNLDELASIKGPGGLKIERDIAFEPTPLNNLLQNQT